MTAVRGVVLLAVLGLVGCISHYVYPEQYEAAQSVCENNGGLKRIETLELNDENPTASVHAKCKNGAYFYNITTQEARHDER